MPSANPDIKRNSKSPDVNVMRQGHTTNGDFGSNPNAKVKGGRTVRDIKLPTT